jgi:hypothetical protein
MTCPASGEAFYGQDSQYGWDTLHAESERFTRDTSVENQPVVLDNVTGITWQGCEAGLSGDVCAAGSAVTTTWQSAVAYCDSLDWGGYQDWHLPDPYELDSIVDLGTGAPSIDPAAFPATPSEWYWASSSYATDPNSAWGVNFVMGHVGYGTKDIHDLVRCARGGPSVNTTPRFTRDTSVSNEPAVLDNVTGLVWQGCAAGVNGNACAYGSAVRYTWQEALAYCEGLSWAGHSDWRLPNKKELGSIMDERQPLPKIDTNAFPATSYDYFYWSSSSAEWSPAGAWIADFGGGVGTSPKDPLTYFYYVRCVRGG